MVFRIDQIFCVVVRESGAKKMLAELHQPGILIRSPISSSVASARGALLQSNSRCFTMSRKSWSASDAARSPSDFLELEKLSSRERRLLAARRDNEAADEKAGEPVITCKVRATGEAGYIQGRGLLLIDGLNQRRVPAYWYVNFIFVLLHDGCRQVV